MPLLVQEESTCCPDVRGQIPDDDFSLLMKQSWLMPSLNRLFLPMNGREVKILESPTLLISSWQYHTRDTSQSTVKDYLPYRKAVT